MQNDIVTQSLVRAALSNTATNLRLSDGVTPISDADERSFIHETGAGLIHLVQAVDVRAVLGTNERNGLGGPDDAADADFLPTHSFGEKAVVSTGIQHQVETVTVTLENVTGAPGAGTYTLGLADGGGTKGDVTSPISGTTGFSLSLGAPSVVLGSALGDRATFDVTVDVDGRAAPVGLALAGTDVQDIPATEFLWWVVASGSNGEVLRMPFAYRAVANLPDPARKAPFLAAIEDDDTPDQSPAGVDRDGRFTLSWTYPAAPAEQPCGFVIERAGRFDGVFADDGEEPLVLGENTTWAGDANWVTATHPDTLTNSYSPTYVDEVDLKLVLNTPISLPEGSAILSFDSFEDIEDGFDYAFVEASGDGGPFIPLASYTGAFSGRRRVDLSGFGGQEVRLRFRFVTDQLISAPLFLGWFIDNVALDSADFHAIATVDGSTFSFDVTEGRKIRSTSRHESFYRVAGRFGGGCSSRGPYSNERGITVDSRSAPPR
jgi:hypothetical protein